MPSMLFVSGPLAGKNLPLAVGTVTLERLAGCDVQLRDMRVSREHCRVWFDPSTRSYMIADPGSAKGTLVEGARLTSERLLIGDEEITLSKTMMRLVRRAPTRDPESDADMLRTRLRGQELIRTFF